MGLALYKEIYQIIHFAEMISCNKELMSRFLRRVGKGLISIVHELQKHSKYRDA